MNLDKGEDYYPEPDVGANFDSVTPEEVAAAQRRTEEWNKRFFGGPRMKVVIELEGPSREGLQTAKDMLMMAGFPPEEGGPTHGEYTDKLLKTTTRWRVEPC